MYSTFEDHWASLAQERMLCWPKKMDLVHAGPHNMYTFGKKIYIYIYRYIMYVCISGMNFPILPGRI